ncbi:MAG: hypothetical protein K6G80_06025 [Treponema sp.]|nr:hypothetical protein [Treponema sp.]
MKGDLHFASAEELEKALPTLASNGITELTVHDRSITAHKGRLLRFLQTAAQKAPDIFYTLPLEAAVLDLDVAKAASALYCTLEIPLYGISKGGTCLFDKRFYAKRATMLNTLGLVFGFSLRFAAVDGDAVKLFRDRLDFAVSQYPNHIDFPQLEEAEPTKKAGGIQARPSRTFSTQDIQRAAETAFACAVFYSQGRAVPWFLSVLAPLKMTASRFFQDFAEWQRVNNCGYGSDWHKRFLTGSIPHTEIENMQLAFLRFKYEEKGKAPLFAAVTDIVRLNGAMARCAGEGDESVVVLQYSPEDLLSPAATDIAHFTDSVCMEDSQVKIFFDEENGVDWEVLV